MSTLSDLMVRLDKPSMDYQRVSVLVHLCAGIMLIYARFPWVMMLCLSLILLYVLRQTLRVKVPMPAYSSLAYQALAWHLHTRDGNVFIYEKARIAFDARFFFLLTLFSQEKSTLLFKKQKNVVIFTDQLSTLEYRMLRIIEKVS